MFSGHSLDVGCGLACVPHGFGCCMGGPGVDSHPVLPCQPLKGPCGVSAQLRPQDRPLMHVFLMRFEKQEIASWYLVHKVIGRRPAKVYNLSADEDEVLV